MEATAVIEFVGLPGAGKTSLIREVRDVMEGAMTPVVGFVALTNRFGPGSHDSKWRRLLSLLPSTKAEWSLVWLLLRLLAFMRPLTLDRLKVAAGLLYTYQAISRARREVSGQLLLDQGLLQILASLRVGGGDHETGAWQRVVRFVINSGGSPDGIVYLDADIPMALERIEGRSSGRSRFDRWPKDVRHSALVEMQSGLTWILEQIQERHQQMLRVYAGLPFKTKVEVIGRWMRESWKVQLEG